MKYLHVGCGDRIIPGWVNVDMEPRTVELPPRTSFIQVDAGYVLPFHDNTISAIYSEDFVEHLTQQQQWNFYAECFRVLKPNGWCRTVTPDLEALLAASDYTQGSRGVVDVWHWGHPCVLSRVSLMELGLDIGFECRPTERNASRYEWMPDDLRPHEPLTDNDYLFMDLHKP